MVKWDLRLLNLTYVHMYLFINGLSATNHLQDYDKTVITRAMIIITELVNYVNY